ncbi:MAG: hypothetical protein ACREGI_01305 [Candidatus Levyibacteriota bacterium]
MLNDPQKINYNQINVPSNQFEQNSQQVHPVKKLLFWEIGIIEVVVILILFSLTIAVLNYFNIVPLSRLPAFSFLPHKVTLQKSLPFFYDQSLAATTLDDYAHGILKSQYLYANKNDIALSQQDNMFSTQWTVNNPNIIFRQSLTFLKNADTPAFEQLTITSSTFPRFSSSDSAALLMGQYFDRDPSTFQWYCNEFPQTQYCERIDLGQNNQEEYGIKWKNDTNTVIIFSCKIPDLSLIHAESQRSCVDAL